MRQNLMKFDLVLLIIDIFFNQYLLCLGVVVYCRPLSDNWVFLVGVSTLYVHGFANTHNSQANYHETRKIIL